ncbi:relaxase domain-containing protein [Streptomyces sp. RGM 3693]|uniref:relaxase domain-containing protein n=1 Tax=Streptomyces sp. RGM 3693 TaxID=3413284 RepID=UPI003D2D1E33
MGATSGWRYYFRGVMVGDGCRPAAKPLHAAQMEADVPAGCWKGRSLPAFGLVADGVVTERQTELLLGKGRHPDADRIEGELRAAGLSPQAARRATVLGRPVEHIESPVLALDLVFRAPPTAQIAWALGDDDTRRVLELCQQIAREWNGWRNLQPRCDGGAMAFTALW